MRDAPSPLLNNARQASRVWEATGADQPRGGSICTLKPPSVSPAANWLTCTRSHGRTRPRRITPTRSLVLVLARHGFKIGIKLKAFQTVPKFSFQGTRGELVLIPDPTVTRELKRTFGVDAGEKWIGFVSPPGGQRKPSIVAPDRLCYKYTLVVRPVRKKPQPVPMVVALRNKPFRQHYLVDVRILTSELRTIKTAVAAVLRRPRPGR